MKLSYQKLFISCIFCGIGTFIGMSLSAFKAPGSYEKAKELVNTSLNEFHSSVIEFAVVVQSGNTGEIRKHYFEHLRPALKRAEWIMAYLDEESYSRWINGAPLPKLEKNVANPQVIAPNGMQTIDEWMGEEQADLNEIIVLSKQLSEKTDLILEIMKQMPLSERQLFEAARRECIRIYTLGVSGFDTPGTLSAMTDAEQSLSSLSAFLRCYQSEAESKGFGFARLEKALSNGLARCNKSDFESFDRAAFYLDCISPVFEGIYNMQLSLNIETLKETDKNTHPFNEHAKGLFSEDFLNADYFAQLPPSLQDKERRELGKMLFFDPILSSNNQRACASCHLPSHGFAENRPKSLAMEGQRTIARNAPGLINAVYAQDFFYDLRSGRMMDQIEHVIFSSDEFNTRYDSVIRKISSIEGYQELFQKAFPEMGDQHISASTINTVLAAYVAGLRDLNSPFDRYMRGEGSVSKSAIRGFNLFMGKAACATCHFPPTFAGLVPPLFEENETEVLGITTNNNFKQPVLDNDPGRFASGKPVDRYPFYKNSIKTTTVRNAAITGPYMHNGAYQTLEELIEFYDLGGGAGMGLDVPHQTLGSDPLNLSKQEKKELIAFIRSLSNNPFSGEKVDALPQSKSHPEWNQRVPGGLY